MLADRGLLGRPASATRLDGARGAAPPGVAARHHRGAPGLPRADDKTLLQAGAVIGRVVWPGALVGGHGPSAAMDQRDAYATLEEREFLGRSAPIVGREASPNTASATSSSATSPTARSRGCAGARCTADGGVAGVAEPRPRRRPRRDARPPLPERLRADTRRRRRHEAELVDPARLALRDAGDRALSLHAFPAAARFFRAALDLWPVRRSRAPVAALPPGQVDLLRRDRRRRDARRGARRAARRRRSRNRGRGRGRSSPTSRTTKAGATASSSTSTARRAGRRARAHALEGGGTRRPRQLPLDGPGARADDRRGDARRSRSPGQLGLARGRGERAVHDRDLARARGRSRRARRPAAQHRDHRGDRLASERPVLRRARGPRVQCRATSKASFELHRRARGAMPRRFGHARLRQVARRRARRRVVLDRRVGPGARSGGLLHRRGRGRHAELHGGLLPRDARAGYAWRAAIAWARSTTPTRPSRSLDPPRSHRRSIRHSPSAPALMFSSARWTRARCSPTSFSRNGGRSSRPIRRRRGRSISPSRSKRSVAEPSWPRRRARSRCERGGWRRWCASSPVTTSRRPSSSGASGPGRTRRWPVCVRGRCCSTTVASARPGELDLPSRFCARSMQRPISSMRNRWGGHPLPRHVHNLEP